MKAKDRILNALRYEGLAWMGGKTSFDLAEELGLHINTVRAKIKELHHERLIYGCFPRFYQRLDDKTANTGIWFRSSNRRVNDAVE